LGWVGRTFLIILTFLMGIMIAGVISIELDIDHCFQKYMTLGVLSNE